MAGLKGILFDLGDTLIDFGKLDTAHLFAEGGRLAYQRLAEMNQPLPPFRPFLRRQLWSVRWNFMLSRVTGREFNSLQLIGSLGRSMGHRLSPAQLEEIAWLWYQPLSAAARVEPGLHEVLAGLLERGLKLAVVSNTFVPGVVLDRHMRDTGLLDFFASRIYSCDVRYRKPHPTIFRKALHALGIGPDEAMFVGDSLVADIKGAARLGMITVLKDPLNVYRPGRIQPTHSIQSLRQLPKIVAEYCR
jgi:putative hydrolase of the HAD superfamily